MHAESLAIRLLPPGVVDGGPAEDDPDAWVGAVQVVHSQCLLISRPSNDEDNNILGPVIKTHTELHQSRTSHAHGGSNPAGFSPQTTFHFCDALG